MIITVLIRRTPNQAATCVVRGWWVGGVSRDLVRIDWDPSGRLTPEEAAAEALERASAALRRLSRFDHGPDVDISI